MGLKDNIKQIVEKRGLTLKDWQMSNLQKIERRFRGGKLTSEEAMRLVVDEIKKTNNAKDANSLSKLGGRLF